MRWNSISEASSASICCGIRFHQHRLWPIELRALLAYLQLHCFPVMLWQFVLKISQFFVNLKFACDVSCCCRFLSSLFSRSEASWPQYPFASCFPKEPTRLLGPQCRHNFPQMVDFFICSSWSSKIECTVEVIFFSLEIKRRAEQPFHVPVHRSRYHHHM